MPVLPPVMIATLPARRFIAVARPSGHHLRPRASGDGLGDAIQRGDHRGDASALDELDGGLDLGPHAAGRELAGGEEPVSLAHGEPVEEAPPGRAPADGDAVHPGQEHDPFGRKLASQHPGGQVLLDDCLHALHPGRQFQDRDAAATDGDRHRARIDERADERRLHDADGPRRRHHAAPAAATVLDDVTSIVARVALGFGLLVEGADRLGRQTEGRIVLGHDDLADDRGDACGQPASGQEIAEDLLDRVTEAALGLGHAEIERQCRHDRLRDLHPQQLFADLGPVAVRQHEAVAGAHEIGERRQAHGKGVEPLARRADSIVGAERVAANGDDDQAHGASASASRACSKQARGARTTPAPIWPVPALRPAMPVLINGVTPSSTTRRTSIPAGAPRSSSVGILKCGCSPTQISSISPVAAIASRMPPAPTNRATEGEAAMAPPPSPIVSTIALSPMSGLASSPEKPGKYRPTGVFTGAVNQRSPSAETRIPKSVPLRAITVTSVECGTPAAGSASALPAAIATLRKNWSLPAMNSANRAAAWWRSAARATWGISARASSADAATLRWCISSPMRSAWAIRGRRAMPPEV